MIWSIGIEGCTFSYQNINAGLSVIELSVQFRNNLDPVLMNFSKGP